MKQVNKKTQSVDIGEKMSSNPTEQNEIDELENVMQLVFRAGFLSGSGLSFVEDKGKSYNEAKQQLTALIQRKVREAYCDVGNYATDSGDIKLMDFVDSRLATLKKGK